MTYNNYNTFKTELKNNILTVKFDLPPVNILGDAMINDLLNLSNELNNDNETKVVVFESLNDKIFIAHADIEMLKKLPTTPVKYEDVVLSNLQIALDKINKLKQVTIAKINGFARGGGHEFCLACDMRFASIENAVFMQMEVGMGVLPCGGGSSRIAKICGLGNALEMILSARDFTAMEAQKIGIINKAIPEKDLDCFVNELATRISKFPLASIDACKKTIYQSVDLTLQESLKNEAYHLHQALSKTPAIKRFQYASETDFQNQMKNQIEFESQLMTLQNIK